MSNDKVKSDVELTSEDQELLDNFNKLGTRGKILLLQKAKLYSDELQKEKEILQAENSNGKHSSRGYVVGTIDDIAIVKTNNDLYAPMVRKIDGWRRVGKHYPSNHLAVLGAIGYFYDGLNSQFDYYAMRMLNISPTSNS